MTRRYEFWLWLGCVAIGMLGTVVTLILLSFARFYVGQWQRSRARRRRAQ